MVTPVGSRPRRIILKANRETLVLVASACLVTFALAYSIRNRPPEPVAAPVAEATSPNQDWAGHLADVSADQTTTVPVQPLSSASLVVPKSALALPTLQPRMKPKPCEGAPCKPPAATPSRAVAKAEPPRPEPRREQHSLMSRLNPLNHLPDADTLGRPFTYAGDTISGWIRRF